MVVFPSSLTEEEEALQKKYAKLRKKKKALLALKKQNSTNQTNQSGLKRTLSDQPVVDTATATEQAKMLIKTGAISAIKSENKNSGFKRSRMLEIKLKDPEKGQIPAFLPFQRSVSADEEQPESVKRAQRKSLYESFVSSKDRYRDEEEGGSVSSGREVDRDKERDREPDRERERDRERDRDRDREREMDRDRERDRERDRDPERERERDRSRDPDRERDREQERERERDAPFRRSDSYPERRGVRKGNTVYVYGSGLGEDNLRSSFSQHGTVIDLSMDNPRNCAFITFEKMESADQAVAELNGAMVGDVHIKVSIARKQPMLDAATGKSVWASLAVQNSTKGSYRDKRNQVVYNEDTFL
ncbi:negative elongation factor E [Pseudoliparis swirei]|uniref:negative elongation factor E n=1 Tax=Pseudoliparis swirei TaxID=2059687 RepID=UPI0024BEAD6E|nr:negative elongation factor E [Pseudoliparis swirei]XP_056278537.1 negative elongation factor E [Pseudoliparis swirei]